MKVVDDFLSSYTLNQIQSHLTSSYIEWYYNANITDPSKKTFKLGQHGFTHWIVRDDNPDVFLSTPTSELLRSLVMRIKEYGGFKNILRSRLDLTLYARKSIRADPHVDFPYPQISTIFYVVDSDGDTVIYNQTHDPQKDPTKRWLTIKKRIKPKANRLVMFDGNHLHTGHNPSKHNSRILVNSNFI